MDIKTLLSPVSKELEKVEKVIFKNIENKIKLITEIGNHIFGSGGKRLRPLLVLLSCKHYNIEDEIIYELAAAIEYIHTATLLHDDVVDNSELRRGRKTANVLWGNQASILMGDYLFAKSFILMVKSNNLKILELISNVTGLLAQGEIFELVKTGDINITTQEYFEIIEEKTAYLISAASQIGPIMADASEDELNSFKNYGKNIGIAFQLVDDALDYTSSDKEFGKKIGNDIKEGKVTLPLIIALKNSTKKDRIIELFYKDELNSQEIDEIRNLVIESNGIDETMRKAKEFALKGKLALEKIDNSPYKELMLKLADFIVERRY